MSEPDFDHVVLAYDFYAGDKDCEPGFRLLSDKMVTARAGGTCGWCRGEVIPGTRIRVEKAVLDDRIRQVKTCNGCCEAIYADEQAWMSTGYPGTFLEDRIYKSRKALEERDES